VSNLQQRVLTATVGLPIVLGLALVGGWPFALAVALVSLLASLEFVHGWLIPSRPIREAVVHIPTIAIAPVTAAAAHLDARFVLMGAAFAAVFAALGYAPTQAFGPRKPFRVYAGCTLYLGVLASMLVLVRDAPNGREWFFIGLLSTFAVDTGAYAVGRAIGRHRMAPRISPKKTWEGAAGGYAAGVGGCPGPERAVRNRRRRVDGAAPGSRAPDCRDGGRPLRKLDEAAHGGEGRERAAAGAWRLHGPPRFGPVRLPGGGAVPAAARALIA
jgi:phosphatidate cytidylyltransferase